MTQTPRRMAGYIRVSRVNGRAGENFISPELQREKIDTWAKLKGIEIVHIDPDLDESGGSQDRPGLREAIHMIERGEVDGIVCAYLSRFARNVAGALSDIERIHNAGGSVAFVQENLDPTTPMGKAMLTVLLAFAALERDNAAQGWLDSRAAAVARCVYLNERPFGYIKGDDGRLAPHPDEAPIMRETYRLAADESLRAAAAYLEQHTTIVMNGNRAERGRRVLRHPSDAPSPYIRPAVLSRILDNRVYLGEQTAGELVNLRNHEPLVSRATWERAQREPTFRRSANNSYPLSGTLTCADCGGPLKGWGMDRHGHLRYGCANYAKKQCPTSALIRADQITEHLLNIIRANYAEDGSNVLLVGRSDDTQDLDALQSAITEAEAERRDYATNPKLRALFGDADYFAGAEARARAVADAQAAYREAAGQTRKRKTWTPQEGLDELEGDDLSDVLSGVFREIAVSAAIVNGKRQRIEDRVIYSLYSDAESMLTA